MSNAGRLRDRTHEPSSPPTPARSASRRAWAVTAAAALLLGLWSAGSSLGSVVTGLEGGITLVAGLLRPDVSPAFLAQVGRGLMETVSISVGGLLLAIVIAFPTALLLAGSTQAPRPLRAGARVLAATLRGVPDLLWALLFVATAGPGAAAGVLALAMHGGGLLAKLWAEQLESVDPGPVEAVRLSGAGRRATAALAILPQARAGLASLLLYQWECNIRTSTVIGFVGAGGVGQLLAISLRLFRYDELSTLVLAVLALVLLMDVASRRLRRHLGAST